MNNIWLCTKTTCWSLYCGLNRLIHVDTSLIYVIFVQMACHILHMDGLPVCAHAYTWCRLQQYQHKVIRKQSLCAEFSLVADSIPTFNILILRWLSCCMLNYPLQYALAGTLQWISQQLIMMESCFSCGQSIDKKAWVGVVWPEFKYILYADIKSTIMWTCNMVVQNIPKLYI